VPVWCRQGDTRPALIKPWFRLTDGNRAARYCVLMSVREDPVFEAFVRTRSAALLRTAFLLTGDHGQAEDLLQTALLRSLRRWRTARSAPEAYVRQVLVNLCRDNWRRAAARPRELPLLPGAETVRPVDGPADRIGQRRDLVSALALLPPGQRAVIVLRFVDDLPVAETAALLGISDGTVKSYTSRAIATLRAALADGEYHIERQAAEVDGAHR
jgi:RNA polymerase sigma-70 factor (sigma-E family)